MNFLTERNELNWRDGQLWSQSTTAGRTQVADNFGLTLQKRAVGSRTTIGNGRPTRPRRQSMPEIEDSAHRMHRRDSSCSDQSLEALKDSDRRKDEFLAMLAHELRNPLVPIRNGIALMKRAREQPALIDEIHPMMERQIGHAVRLIDDLLDVSRISSGKIELQRAPVTLTSVVESAVEANREALATAGLELQVELDNPDRLLDVDPTRLPQVISNILHNAIKFTPRGGKITLRSVFVSVGEAAPAELIIRIADAGIGIDREFLPTIFGLFAQGHSDSAVRHGGLGIGLALARSLVELHGGSISADSMGPNQGSKFTVRIPGARDHPNEIGRDAEYN